MRQGQRPLHFPGSATITAAATPPPLWAQSGREGSSGSLEGRGTRACHMLPLPCQSFFFNQPGWWGLIWGWGQGVGTTPAPEATIPASPMLGPALKVGGLLQAPLHEPREAALSSRQGSPRNSLQSAGSRSRCQLPRRGSGVFGRPALTMGPEGHFLLFGQQAPQGGTMAEQRATDLAAAARPTADPSVTRWAYANTPHVLRGEGAAGHLSTANGMENQGLEPALHSTAEGSHLGGSALATGVPKQPLLKVLGLGLTSWGSLAALSPQGLHARGCMPFGGGHKIRPLWR